MGFIKASGRQRRKRRIRKKIQGTPERPRLAVFKSAKHIYAQIIDDVNGYTLASASTLGKTPVEGAGNIKGAKVVGELLAERALSKKIDRVVFDRGGFKFHGRMKALAEAARGKGLKF